MIHDETTPVPDLPEEEFRQWAHRAIAAGEITQYRGTIGVYAGWRFLIGEVRGTTTMRIAGYEPEETWQEPISIISDVIALDHYLRGLAA